jgi:hypothetical protein
MLDFWGYYDAYNHSQNGAEADAKAIYADWRTVGEHLSEAMQSYEVVTAGENEKREQRVERSTAV